jgi:hypothetical protein
MARRASHGFVFAAIATAAILAPVEFAAAQQLRVPVYGQTPPPQAPQAPRGFFEMLFGPLQTQPYPPPQPARPRTTAPAPQAQAPLVPVVPKDPMARKILVVGDFVGSVVAAGLDQTFANEPKARVIDRDNPNSGLARQDYYDWGRQLPGILSAERPDAVVVVLGANDRQMLQGSSTAQWGTPEWDDAYSNRVAALAASLAAYGAPFLWVGTVPMRSTPEPDMAHINDMTEPRVMAAGGTYVDVWDGFADENGRLLVSGPDVNGQTVPLRTGNGINFTAAGQAKLAFYVERDIRRATGLTGAAAADLTASLLQGSRLEIGPDGKRRLVGPVISLSDPAPGSATQLAGQGNATGTLPLPLLAAPKDAKSPQALLIRGAALPVVSGRADDFTWPRVPPQPAAPVSSPAVAAAK